MVVRGYGGAVCRLGIVASIDLYGADVRLPGLRQLPNFTRLSKLPILTRTVQVIIIAPADPYRPLHVARRSSPTRDLARGQQSGAIAFDGGGNSPIDVAR